MASARRMPTPPRASCAGRARRSAARPLVAGVAIADPDRPIGGIALTKLDLVRDVERVGSLGPLRASRSRRRTAARSGSDASPLR
jgi:hypothetical protein